MKMLIRDIKALGFVMGWRYNRVRRLANSDPEFVNRWADGCDLAASRSSNEFEAEMLRQWAALLRMHHKR